MTYTQRSLFNHATQVALRNGARERDEEVQAVDQLRRDLDLRTRDIDELLDRPENWYANRIQGGTGSHRFTVADFATVEFLLEEINTHSRAYVDDHLSDLYRAYLDQYGVAAELHRLQMLEYMRGLVDVDPQQITAALNRPDNWYVDIRNRDVPVSLTGWWEAKLLLKHTVFVSIYERYLSEDVLDDMIDYGYLDAEMRHYL